MDRSIFTEVALHTKNRVTSFDFVGLTDPSAPNPNKTLTWLKQLHHDVPVYPESCYDPTFVNPPACIFAPEPALMNKMIETVAKNCKDVALIYTKFSTMDWPVP